MQKSLLFLSLILVSHSWTALAIVAGGPSASKAVAPSRTKNVLASRPVASAALVQKHGNARKFGEQPPDYLVRPNAGQKREEVKFGLRAMNFFGDDLKHHRFTVDMVMSVRWKDERVIKMVPKGLDKVSMAWSAAEELIWMPGIVVSNRDIEKYEIVSSSVTMYRTGEVVRVERANTRVMKKFDLAAYPFDTQDLAINIASSKYMLDEVVLVPDEKSSGVYENIWGLYNFKKWRTESYEAFDGELVKSRGALVVTVERSLEKYSQDHLLPASIVLMISWAVFYFPYANPFITPRLALSVLALLTFTALMVKSADCLPGAAPFNWNDLFNQQIQSLMFVTIVVNISSEIAFHTFHKEKTARGLNHEAKILMPLMSVITILIILGGGANHWMTLSTATTLTKIVLAALVACYVGYTAFGVMYHEEDDAGIATK